MKYIIGIGALILLVAAVVLNGEQPQPNELGDNTVVATNETNIDTEEENNDLVLENEAVTEVDTTMPVQVEDFANNTEPESAPGLRIRGYTPGTFSAYSNGIISNLEDKRIVLAFLADWCPTCQLIKSDIQENLARIPSDVAILEVDYDNSSQLRQRYGVTTQHSFVQVNSSGEVINSWRGGNTLSDLLSNI